MTYYENIIRKEHAKRAREHAQLIRYIARLEAENQLLKDKVRKLQTTIASLQGKPREQ